MLFVPKHITPTQEQVHIQTALEKTILVQANAGAAKTTTLALRTGQALKQGIAPDQLLILTYTEPACLAMRQALSKIGLAAPEIDGLQIYTFEQFAAHILWGVEGKKVARKVHPEELAPTVWQALEQLNEGMAGDYLVEQFLALSCQLKGTLARDLRLWEGERISPEFSEELGVDHQLMRLYGMFEHLRYPEGDHCDQPNFRGPMDATYDLARLLANPESHTMVHELSHWPTRLVHVLVDEMHDLNLASFVVLQALLKNTHTHFCGVGDIDQVVFSQAGAQQRYMQPDADFGANRRVKTYPLTASRRFSAPLSAMAKRLTDKAYASECAHKTKVHCTPYESAAHCADLVVAQALAWKKTHPRDMRGFAILVRHPYQSVHLENALFQAQLPYETMGLTSYLRQPEVLLVRALLALHSQGFAQFTSQSLREDIVRALVFFCGVKLDYLGSSKDSPQQRLQEAIRVIATDVDLLPVFFEQQVLRLSEPRIVRRLKNAVQACHLSGPQMFPAVLQALEIAPWVQSVFVEKQRRCDALSYMEGLAQAAQKFSCAQDFFENLNAAESHLPTTHSARIDKAKATVRKKNMLLLATVSQVKGLEFDHVVMPYLAQDEFPAPLAHSLREERNLFYVGITRAREVLSLLVDCDQPSEFVQKSMPLVLSVVWVLSAWLTWQSSHSLLLG
jgi:DNA helicase II / ATP-dependent DNA helicase PcrA